MAFLDKLKETATKATEYAKEAGKQIADKTGDVLEVTKLNAEIATQKTTINSLKKELGEVYWTKYAAGLVDDEDAKVICTKISDALAQIKTLEEKIADVKAGKDDCECEGKTECCCEEGKAECCCEENKTECCCDEGKTECCCEEEKPTVKICPLCGAEQKADAKVCEICGYEFEA